MENTTDFFAHTLSFQKKNKQENRNRIQKTVYHHFPSKNNFFHSWIHQKKDNKKNRVYKKNQKMRVKQNEKPFFKRQKNKTWKNTEV